VAGAVCLRSWSMVMGESVIAIHAVFSNSE
jgi:hypothetical protein